ncbi:MAG TPA: Rieske (2Fe-2S) protein [Candidatus Dormibacteraeota bacterium]
MPEDDEVKRSRRLEEVVRDLLAGKRLRIGTADAHDRDAIMAAAALAGQRDPYPRMSPVFRRRLAARLEPAREPGLLSRRSALVAGLAAAAGALAGTGVGRLLQPAPQVVRYGSATVFPAVRWYDAGPLSAFKEGVPVRFQAGSVGTYLVREGQNVNGLSSVCTHLPCELNWTPSAHQLTCPCHNVAFDTEGFQITSPESYPLPPLPRVQVRITPAGRVEVGAT